MHDLEGTRVDRVQPKPALPADPDQPGLTKDPEVLGYRRLGEREPSDQPSDRPLATSQEVQDPPPGGVGDGPVHPILPRRRHGQKYT